MEVNPSTMPPKSQASTQTKPLFSNAGRTIESQTTAEKITKKKLIIYSSIAANAIAPENYNYQLSIHCKNRSFYTKAKDSGSQYECSTNKLPKRTF